MKYGILLSLTLLIFSCFLARAQENITEPNRGFYVKLLYKGNHETKLFALAKIAESGSKDDEVIDALISCLQEGTSFIERKAGKIVNDFWDVRAKSAEILGEIGDPRALDYLHTALLHDKDPMVRSCVAIALGKIRLPESIFFLAQAIKTSEVCGSDEIVIKSCVEAIGEIGHEDGILPLFEVIHGGYRRNIKLAAMDALKKLNWK